LFIVSSLRVIACQGCRFGSFSVLALTFDRICFEVHVDVCPTGDFFEVILVELNLIFLFFTNRSAGRCIFALALPAKTLSVISPPVQKRAIDHTAVSNKSSLAT